MKKISFLFSGIILLISMGFISCSNTTGSPDLDPGPGPEPTPPTYYSITVNPSDNGTIGANTSSAVAGASITVSVTPGDSYRLKKLSYSDSADIYNGEGAPENSYTFSMPAANITLSAEFVPILEGAAEKTVTIGSLTNGTITANPAKTIAGTPITLTVTPDSGYRLKAGTLKYNDGSDHIISGDIFNMPAAGATVSAEFEQVYTITIDSGSNGTVTIQGADSAVAAAGDTVTVLVNANPGYEIGILSFSPSLSLDSLSAFTMPSTDVTITATFKLVEGTVKTITIAPAEHGYFTSNVSKANSGIAIIIIPHPDSGYKYMDGSLKHDGPGGDPLAIDLNFLMPDANITVRGQFEKKSYSLSVMSSLSNGSISLSPVGDVQYGDQIIVTVTPNTNTGYQLKAGTLVYGHDSNWIPIIKTGNEYTFTLGDYVEGQALTVKADFEKATYLISNGGAAEGGTFTIDKSAAKMDETVIVTPHPTLGWEISQVIWTDGTDPVTSTPWQFAMPAHNVTVSAVFIKKDLALTKGSVTGGTFDINPTDTAQVGDTVTVYPHPADGWETSKITWTWNDGTTKISEKNSAPWEFTMPGTAGTPVTVTVTFVKINYTITPVSATGTGSGIFVIDKTSAQVGDTVTVTPTTYGSTVSKITWTWNDGTTKISEKNSAPWQFAMPPHNVTVSVEFTGQEKTLSIINAPSISSTLYFRSFLYDTVSLSGKPVNVSGRIPVAVIESDTDSVTNGTIYTNASKNEAWIKGGSYYVRVEVYGDSERLMKVYDFITLEPILIDDTANTFSYNSLGPLNSNNRVLTITDFPLGDGWEVNIQKGEYLSNNGGDGDNYVVANIGDELSNGETVHRPIFAHSDDFPPSFWTPSVSDYYVFFTKEPNDDGHRTTIYRAGPYPFIDYETVINPGDIHEYGGTTITITSLPPGSNGKVLSISVTPASPEGGYEDVHGYTPPALIASEQVAARLVTDTAGFLRIDPFTPSGPCQVSIRIDEPGSYMVGASWKSYYTTEDINISGNHITLDLSNSDLWWQP